MTPIEIMALAVVLYALIKLVLTPIRNSLWQKSVTKRAWANPIVTSVASLLLVVVTLFFLLEELTIVQIFAAGAFAFSLVMLGFAPYAREMPAIEKKMFSDWKRGWLAFLVWTVLIIWVLYALFF